MSLNSLIQSAQRSLQSNSPAILTGLGVAGVLGTAYLAGKATWKARGAIQEAVIDIEAEAFARSELPREMETKEKVEHVWKLYIPTAVSATLTVGCIIGGQRLGMKRTAAAMALLNITELGFTEYKEKVIQTIGEKKEQAIRDEIAQDRVNANPNNSVIVLGGGDVLCYEMHTGRYFHSDMETIRSAVNEINAKLLHNGEASLHDFYYLLNLGHTRDCGTIGWTSDKLLKIDYSAVMSEDEHLGKRPCMAIDYNYVKSLVNE